MFIPKVTLHPLSIKVLKRGHYWITQDQYTKRFPNALFLLGSETGRRDFDLIIHDPKHPKIKARVWIRGYRQQQYSRKQFVLELEKRIESSISKRTFHSKRDNGYLIFGEADQLPGLFVQQLGSRLLVQFYSYFWEKYSNELLNILKKYSKNVNSIWTQVREKQQKPPQKVWGTGEAKFTIKEFALNYNIDLSSYYDIGIYSDMASIREQLPEQLFKDKDVLNLYSYTGAFSLWALKNGARNVVSVDLSAKYLKWLEQNLAINHFKKSQVHTSECIKCESYLKKEQKFDLIISDPPSFSSNGKKSNSALKQYETELPLIYQNLKRGGYALIFLNTHQVSLKKFTEKVDRILKGKSIKIIEKYRLGSDCPVAKGFTEGDYLVGLLIQK